MAGKRLARLNEQFKREISEILRRQVRDPRIGTPTVTDVEVTPDLWMARVYVRPGPGEDTEERGDDLIAGLQAATPFVRRELAQSLTVRRIPELRFELDRTLEHALRIEELLREVLPDEEEEGEEASGEDGSEGKGEGSGPSDAGVPE
jgi:ribosome-binding factor A